MRIAYLIGSGISVPAKIPGVAEITSRVLSGRSVIRYAGSFVVGSSPNAWDAVKADDPTLRHVRELARIDEHFYTRVGVEHTTTYEDIAFLATQINDCLLFEYENPALLPLIDELAERSTSSRTSCATSRTA